MACAPLSAERCVFLRAISGCFSDAVMAKIGQNVSLLNTHMKIEEKKPPRYPPQHTHTLTAIPFQVPAESMYDVVKVQPGPAPTTCAG